MNDSKDHKAAAEPPLDCRVGHDELCLDENGEICIDWASTEGDMLSIILGENGQISFAVRMADGRKSHGATGIAPEAFEVLRKLVPNGILSRKRHDYRPHITKAEREHTPPELARWLVELAHRCKGHNVK